MALTKTSPNANKNDKDCEDDTRDRRRSKSPKVAVRGRGAWKPTPKPLLPSQVMLLKLEVPKEPEIMRFGVPYFGHRGQSEEDGQEEGGEGEFDLEKSEKTDKMPVKKELSNASLKSRARREALLAEKDNEKLDEGEDLGSPKSTEELQSIQELKVTEKEEKVQRPKRRESLTKLGVKAMVRKAEEKAVKKPRLKPEQITERNPYKFYQSPTTERKPFQMKKQSELPARIQTPAPRVRELSQGPRSQTIASRLKWVTRSPSPLEKQWPTNSWSSGPYSQSVFFPISRGNTPTPIFHSPRREESQTPNGRFLSPPPLESLPRRPSSASWLERGANASLPRNWTPRRRVPEPLIPVVPQEHILRLAGVVESNSEGAIEDMSRPLVPEASLKPEIWNNSMEEEELCPGCRRCAVKFEFVCGDMICGGCYDRLLKENGEGDVRCITCQAVVG
ncbi:hypothetical protein L873DRAFT_1788538 [Choiromyces venosus 120613-1]|uniref:Uncharacterized protein n=1 Tax=Choiromyces venosus 120613-1 TaxID=1336337 RepID=A0A3N4JWP5_9PEZI|nr:hypothetical protein L873DRAFT_1788538 [Choiromyces venosus 120613-1]